MKHDVLCELSHASWHQMCNCGSRALKRDPVPDDIVPIYPWSSPELLDDSSYNYFLAVPPRRQKDS